MPLDKHARAEAKRLSKELAGIGMVLPGTLSHRLTRCGRSGCKCHGDPPAMHCPYWWWTRKHESRTITHLLTDEQAAEYTAWFENMRKLRQIMSELEALGLKVVADDPRSARRPGGRKPKARPTEADHRNDIPSEDATN
jgi:hypothetical protein